MSSKIESICVDCDWNSIEFDEYGAIDYCTKRDIYSDEMEKIIECPHYRNEKVYSEIDI